MKSSSYRHGLTRLLEDIDNAKNSLRSRVIRGQGVSQMTEQHARKDLTLARHLQVQYRIRGGNSFLTGNSSTGPAWDIEGAPSTMPLGGKIKNVYRSTRIWPSVRSVGGTGERRKHW